ncbi:MAG TPA: iron ABC transporter permease [Acidimicrobiia bacterium]
MKGQERGVSADPYRRRRRGGVPILIVALLVASGLSLSLGAVDLAGVEVAAVLSGKLGLSWFGEAGSQAEAVVWGIRLPRLLMGVVVGAALAATGAVLQGVLRTDLADPHLLGIGPGAAIGAAIGAGAGGVPGAIAGGVAAGIMTSLFVRRLHRRASADQTRLILSGVALGATLGAWVGFVVFASNRSVVPPIEFWLLGGLAGSTWRAVGTATVYLVLAVGGLITVTRTIDLLAVGPSEAWQLGVDVDLTMTIIFIVVGAAVGVTVGAVGVVAFVGLLVPFLMRRLAGPLHRHLIPAAMVGGALLLVSADLLSRLLIEPVEVPVGLITAAVGGPLFLWLISKGRDG